MTEFYESQPAELPLTLPAGTRSKHKMPYVSEKTATLSPLHGGCYMGDWGEAHVSGIEAEWIDWTSVPIAPPVEDRPIQAGDWLECVNATCRDEALTVGERYQVERMFEQSDPRRPQFALHGVESPAFGWCASRFKRVEGPHPVEVGEVKAHDGPVVVVRDGHGNIDTVPQCGGCSAPATNGAWCAYCACSTNGGRQDRGVTDRIAASATSKSPRMVEPGKKLEAALRREAERPRLTADARELAKPHPWEEF